MLCIQSKDLDTIAIAIGELLHNRQHLDLHEDDRALLIDAEKVVTKVREITASAEEMSAASDEHACDEIEIDDEASVSRADEGYWVSAWVWVATPEADDDEQACGQCEGTGRTDAMGHDEECPVCDGSGRIDA
jgi:hypothetical protein